MKVKHGRKRSRGKIEDRVRSLSNAGLKIPERLQGVTLDAVAHTLDAIDLYTEDMRDAVWCLLNDQLPSWIASKKAQGFTLADGATTAQIACYIGILLRGDTKLDREGRDYWLKPLEEIGALEPVTFISEIGEFVPGHVVSKSGYTARKLNPSFVRLMQMAGTERFKSACHAWISEDTKRHRLHILQDSQKKSIERLGISKHEQLIQDATSIYAKHFLPNYEVIFIDCRDGKRISEDQESKLRDAGVDLGLGDKYADALLHDRRTGTLWIIEAVTSDGEVDLQKWDGLEALCRRCGKQFGGATTVYDSWKLFASRQAKCRNLCVGSRVWIRQDPTKEFVVSGPPIIREIE